MQGDISSHPHLLLFRIKNQERAMTSKIVLILVLFCSFVFLATTRSVSTSTESSTSAGVSQQSSITSEQAQSMKDELAKMRSLVQQMETNLSVVDTTQSPLKHQFQLEIDMWRMMIQRMEKQLRDRDKDSVRPQLSPASRIRCW